jgi:hypothetical protein
MMLAWHVPDVEVVVLLYRVRKLKEEQCRGLAIPSVALIVCCYCLHNKEVAALESMLAKGQPCIAWTPDHVHVC